MTATATASTGSGPRYAPEDPTLPKPWRGLVDGSTGYLYYWNPDTNVTQYERPAIEELPPPPPLPPKLPPFSSVQVHQHRHDDDGRSRSQQHQVVRITSGRSGHSSVDVGHGSSGAQNHAQVPLHSRPSARIHGHSEVNGLSIEAYRRQHEITVIGDDVPSPFLTFESTGFPLEILKEVRYLLQGGANVVLCCIVLPSLVRDAFYWSALCGGLFFGRAFRCASSLAAPTRVACK